MEPVTGIFRSIEEARRGAEQLRRNGFRAEQVNLLFPGASEEQIHSVPVSDTEQPGVGGAIGGVLGAALGMAGGFELGVAATALIPGVGPVLAAGIAGAALLGTGGAIGGAALGEAADEESTEGIPADEVFFYEDALRHGESLVIVLAKNTTEAGKAREVLHESGGASVAAARKAWWIGLHDGEEEHYRSMGGNFATDHDAYRAGFEAALRRDCRGKSATDAAEQLKQVYPDVSESKAFMAGYERGAAHLESVEKDAAGSRYLAG